MDRTWMYERFNPSKTQLRHEFIRGVNEFVETAKNSRYYLSEGAIRCPCVKCRNMKLFDEAYVKTHLYKYGFKPDYWIWTEHGEERVVESDLAGHSSNLECDDDDGNQFEMMHNMVTDAFGPFVGDTYHSYGETVNEVEPPNPECQKFYDKLMAANQPIYEGCSESTLSIVVRLLAARSNWKVP
jgi:hypothetical protein